MIRVESHCHTCYSIDSSLPIRKIVNQCKKQGINGIVICDHDVYGLTREDERMFESNKIQLMKGIEFTTSEGVHIIGVSDEIKKLEKERGSYSARRLVDRLSEENAVIIVPHPNHSTGVIGNTNIKEIDAKYVLLNASFIEQANYKYGNTKEMDDILKKYNHLVTMVGSDAHSAKNIGAFYNEIDTDEESLQIEKVKNFRKLKRKEHNWVYWKIKRIKTTKIYQFFLKLFPVSFRRYIKNRIINK
ncbi:MAG: PHP domain-containing protein [Lachnospiraceae bacterium]|jgi:predicted metal-dependent phosphoesterase TrpH|nr:PHP domain-containing protein [Lachnospiraceae bacterium]